jgi:hypothetical protein
MAGPAQDAPATADDKGAQKAYADAEGGAAERTSGLQAFQRAAHGISLSFHSVGQGATHTRLATMRTGKVVGKLFDAFQACGQRDVARLRRHALSIRGDERFTPPGSDFSFNSGDGLGAVWNTRSDTRRSIQRHSTLEGRNRHRPHAVSRPLGPEPGERLEIQP